MKRDPAPLALKPRFILTAWTVLLSTGAALAQNESAKSTAGRLTFASAPSTQPASAAAHRPLAYERYLDQVLGGWIGKSLGGAAGARFEGYKGWVEVSPDKMLPEKLPPNDDLDLQVLWLKVLEEKGAALAADDLAAAWLEGCWYPFNEYGIFRRNWRLGIHPPASGRFTNQFWETGMGCPIRAEIWGYVFPGAPEQAARYAALDGSLDHTAQSIGGEQMFAALAAMAFFEPDTSALATRFTHYLPEGTPIARLTRVAFDCHKEGLSLRDARDRIMVLGGVPEACDAQMNVPFTFLALLYGEGDLQKTILAALSCGYDTDCSAATSGALVGQILGASRIPEALERAVGDQLVMGIEYRRPEMTLSALARDTARIGVLLSKECQTGIEFQGTPELKPLPATARPPSLRVTMKYAGQPAAAPGDAVTVTLRADPRWPPGGIHLQHPPGWTIAVRRTSADAGSEEEFVLRAQADATEWPMKNIFTVNAQTDPPTTYTFGVAGAGLYRFLGVYYDAVPDENNPVQAGRRFQQHFVSLSKPYLPEPDLDVAGLYKMWSQKLGKPAVVASYEHEIDLSQLVGLRGPYCAYLARTVISPEDRPVYVVVGNNDGYRVYLNGEKIGEADESVWWTPFNNGHRAKLRKGPNQLLVKLLKHGDDLKFTLGFRADQRGGGFNSEDWLVDLADAVP